MDRLLPALAVTATAMVPVVVTEGEARPTPRPPVRPPTFPTLLPWTTARVPGVGAAEVHQPALVVTRPAALPLRPPT